jgi:hypothetical protein
VLENKALTLLTSTFTKQRFPILHFDSEQITINLNLFTLKDGKLRVKSSKAVEKLLIIEKVVGDLSIHFFRLFISFVYLDFNA